MTPNSPLPGKMPVGLTFSRPSAKVEHPAVVGDDLDAAVELGDVEARRGRVGAGILHEGQADRHLQARRLTASSR